MRGHFDFLMIFNKRAGGCRGGNRPYLLNLHRPVMCSQVIFFYNETLIALKKLTSARSLNIITRRKRLLRIMMMWQSELKYYIFFIFLNFFFYLTRSKSVALTILMNIPLAATFYTFDYYFYWRLIPNSSRFFSSLSTLLFIIARPSSKALYFRLI